MNEQQDFIKALAEFNTANKKEWELAADNFVPALQKLAAKIDKRLRVEQLVAIRLLIES